MHTPTANSFPSLSFWHIRVFVEREWNNTTTMMIVYIFLRLFHTSFHSLLHTQQIQCVFKSSHFIFRRFHWNFSQAKISFLHIFFFLYNSSRARERHTNTLTHSRLCTDTNTCCSEASGFLLLLCGVRAK